MKIREVCAKKIDVIKDDERVLGILLTGSLARGTETEFSDLDIIVLYDSDFIVEEVLEGVPVETHYNSVDKVRERFVSDPTFCYLWKYGKIMFSRGNALENLVKESCERLENYTLSSERKCYLNHKVCALKEKLNASVALKDQDKINYLIHNNFKVIVESLYALNSLPTPPQGLNYEIYNEIKAKPCENWMLKLITLKGVEQGEFALEVVSFIGVL